VSQRRVGRDSLIMDTARVSHKAICEFFTCITYHHRVDRVSMVAVEVIVLALQILQLLHKSAAQSSRRTFSSQMV